MSDEQLKPETVTMSGATGSRKIREFTCSNEDCEAHQYSWEVFVRESERESQCCPLCESKAQELIGCVNGWVKCDKRSKEQLKKRSKAHMDWCRKKGIHPNDTGYSPGNREWVNKTRAKNTSRSTISQFKNIHKTWNPGKEIIRNH